MNPRIEFAKAFRECKSQAIKSITECYHPDCNNPSINSHILQKNGILSKIAIDRHVWEFGINEFKDPMFEFQNTGINNVYSFNCFCEKHDLELFKDIEQEIIDFSSYRTHLLFTIRTVYNEIFRKEVNLITYNCFKKRFPDRWSMEMDQLLENEKLGLKDLEYLEKNIWNDFKTGSESFIFNFREMAMIDICLSGFYNYDTTEEMAKYIEYYGHDMDRLSHIFVNFFPQQNSSVLMMGYTKNDEKKVKGYFNRFFKENEKKVQRLFTNLMLFNCETWVISTSLYKNQIKPIEELFASTAEFAVRNHNERTNFDLNIFNDNFEDKLTTWSKAFK